MPEMVGGAIAASGDRTRATGVGAHREALKAVRDAQREKHEKQVDDYYAAVDEDGNGRLDRDEIGALLKAITGKAPTRQGLDIVMKAAGGEEEEKAGGVTKENLLRALKKYNAYLDSQNTISRVYGQYDEDGSGCLEREEVVALLQSIAEDPDKMRIELGMGTQPYAGVKVEPSEADLLTVLDTADVDHDGNISREEVLGAIGTWLQLIYQMQRDEWTRKIQEKKRRRSAMCRIA